MIRKVRFQGSSLRRWPHYLLVLLAALLLYQFAGYREVVALLDTWRQEEQMRSRIEAVKEENDRIEASIKDLSPEGQEVERIARQLGWAKPGEIVIKIPEKK